MGSFAYVLTRPLGEIDLTGGPTEAQRQILAATRAGLTRRFRLAGLLLGNVADAEDATQEAMLRAWRSAASLRDTARVDPWLDGILVNICRDRMRRRRIVRFIPLADGVGSAARDEFQSVLDRDEVVRAMRELDADQRIVVVLHYWSGLTLEDIARPPGLARRDGEVAPASRPAPDALRARYPEHASRGIDVSDDLDRRLREGLRDLPLPDAPLALHAAADRLEAEPVRPVPPRGRAMLQAVPVLVIVVVIGSVLVWGSRAQLGTTTTASAAQPSEVASAAGQSSTPSAEPSAAPASPPQATGGPLAATDAGLSMTATLSATDVAPGGSLRINVTIRNDRTAPVTLALGPCGAPATMSVTVPMPTAPAGRTWNGIAGEFKSFALEQANGNGGAPPTLPFSSYATASPCNQDATETTLDPGRTVVAKLTWKAELVAGVAALPGPVTFEVSVGHDPVGGPPSYPPGYKGPLASWFKTYQQLTVGGSIDISGPSPDVVTVGEALDSMLADHRFAAWLSEQPASTWSVANVLLQNIGEAQGIIPAGPSWEVDLFREVGVPRNWAIGFVDPHTGDLRNLTMCNVPCDR